MPLTKEQLAAIYEVHEHYAVPWTSLAQISGNTYKHFHKLKKHLENRPPKTESKKEECLESSSNIFLMRSAK